VRDRDSAAGGAVDEGERDWGRVRGGHGGGNYRRIQSRG
jgi:hypothetical protein